MQVIHCIDLIDNPDIAIEHPKIIIVAPMNHPVAYAKDSFPDLQLALAFRGRIGRCLDHLIQIDRPQTPPGHG